MKREAALQIATNYYTQKKSVQPDGLKVKRMEPANGKIVLQADGHDQENGDVVYEIEIDPISETIVMKQIVCADDLGDFTKAPKRLSQLIKGTLFRMKGDSTVWCYRGITKRDGAFIYGYTLKDDTRMNWHTDMVVYPCEE